MTTFQLQYSYSIPDVLNTYMTFKKYFFKLLIPARNEMNQTNLQMNEDRITNNSQNAQDNHKWEISHFFVSPLQYSVQFALTHVSFLPFGSTKMRCVVVR